MFDIDHEIERWLGRAIESNPSLADHRVELADHIRTAFDAADSDGAPESTFAAIIEDLGAPTAIAGEFDRSHGLLARVRVALCADYARSTPITAALWILLSLAWTAGMVIYADRAMILMMGWLLTTFLPLTAVDGYLRRRRTA